MSNWILIVIAVVIVAGAALGYTSFSSGVPVEAATVASGSIREYVDEEGKTRLAETYLVTMPYNGRIEPIDLIEGTPVTKGQVVAHIKQVDIELRYRRAKAVVERLKASIKENDDTSVEETALKQTVNMVESVDRMVEAAEARARKRQGQARIRRETPTRAAAAHPKRRPDRRRTRSGRNATGRKQRRLPARQAGVSLGPSNAGRHGAVAHDGAAIHPAQGSDTRRARTAIGRSRSATCAKPRRTPGWAR